MVTAERDYKFVIFTDSKNFCTIIWLMLQDPSEWGKARDLFEKAAIIPIAMAGQVWLRDFQLGNFDKSEKNL